MKKTLLFIAIIALLDNQVSAQNNFSTKVETGYLKFGFRPYVNKASEGWGGHYLNSNQNGFNINVIEKWQPKASNFSIGVGAGYMNYEGMNGFQVFGEGEYYNKENKWAFVHNVRIGYSHLNNQYENGTGTVLLNYNAGINYKINSNLSMYLQTGILLNQQAIQFPLFLGIRF